MWAVYRFHLSSVSALRGSHPLIDSRVANTTLRRAAYAVVEFPLPLMEVANGLNELREHGVNGHESFLLGEFRRTGWWYFFPLVIAVKTPIGFLLLALAGLAIVLRQWRAGPWQQILTAIFPVVILLVCLPSTINVGIRHVLAIYPMLSIVAGSAVAQQPKARRRGPSVAAGALVLWATASSVFAHPDYMAYFNEFASKSPEKIRTDSDLDWGQDVYRLRDRLRALHAPSVALECYCTMPLASMGLPQIHEIPRSMPVPGLVAISVQFLELEHAKNGSYEWLRRYKPFERVGKSILLYRIPENNP